MEKPCCRRFILEIAEQIVRNSKSLLKLILQQRMVFDVLAVEVLVPAARTPLAIPARVALAFPKPRPLSHESLSFAGANLPLRWHVLIVVALVVATEDTGHKSGVDHGEKTPLLLACSFDHRVTPTVRRR
jgi:hypothetical protein